MSTAPDKPRHNVEKELAPIRWPHPGGVFLGLLGLWLVGLFISVFVPALIVPPGASSAPTGEVLLALGFTALGALIMVAVGIIFWRRHEDPVATAFGVVPAIAVIAGGAIMAATKLTGLS